MQTQVLLIKDNSKDETKQSQGLSLKSMKGHIGDLKNADCFQINGVVHVGGTVKEPFITFAGKEYLHRFDLHTHSFTTIRKIEH